jgi:hypothetical protein
MSDQSRRYIVKRRWWYPIAVEVWDTRWSEGQHWKKGHYWIWWRKGIFFRRSTAEEFARRLEAGEKITA